VSLSVKSTPPDDNVALADDNKFPWLNIAALGSPVVPDV
jgi:hypothetical protein